MGYNIVRLLQFNTLNRNRLKRRNKDSYRQEDKITYENDIDFRINGFEKGDALSK